MFCDIERIFRLLKRRTMHCQFGEYHITKRMSQKDVRAKQCLIIGVLYKVSEPSDSFQLQIDLRTIHQFFVCSCHFSFDFFYRHLFLGQTLLLGLLLGSCVGFAYAVEPNEFSCAAVRLGTGLSYGLIYTSLLVKQNFLISLNNGVYLPASYQVLLFLFAIITQVVIGVFWLSISTVFQISLCDYSSGEHMLALLYVIFLILFVSGLAVKSWHCRDNYR